MNHEILICYKSVTGFTEKYAEMIAKETGGKLIKAGKVTAEIMSKYDTVVFGGRFHAGMVDGLKKMKELAAKSGVKTFIVFATGAMPAIAKETIQQAWSNNLTSEELGRIPHFYMPGGLCYEKMPLPDKLMMKAFAAVMKGKLKNKKDKTEEDREFERLISTSYDLSSKEYINPLVDLLNGKRK